MLSDASGDIEMLWDDLRNPEVLLHCLGCVGMLWDALGCFGMLIGRLGLRVEGNTPVGLGLYG